MLTTRAGANVSSARGGLYLAGLIALTVLAVTSCSSSDDESTGAKDKSDERGAQAHVRTAFTNERLEYTEREAYADATVMARAEPSLRWTAEQLSAASPEKSVYVDVLDGGRAVVLASRSEGTCFYLRNAATGDAKGTFYADQTVGSGDCTLAPAAVDDARW